MEFLNEDKRSWSALTDDEKGKLLLAFHEGKVIQEWGEDEDEGGHYWYDVECGHCYPPLWVHGIWRIKPEPVKEVGWMNDYGHEVSSRWWSSRAMADDVVHGNRIAVIRREIVDGVVSYYREDV